MSHKKSRLFLFILTGLSAGLITLGFAGRSLADNKIFLPIIVKAVYYEPEKGISLAKPNCEDITKVGAGWYLNFSYLPSTGCPTSDKRFVPIIYNASIANDSTMLAAAINNAKASGWLVGFGEPNLAWNGNTTPLEGAKAWRKIEEAALPQGLKLVSPFPSPHNPNTYIRPDYPLDPYGYSWTWQMIQEYQTLYGTKPHFDAIGWNYYLIQFPPDPQDALDFLNARRQEALARGYDVPFWLLEYAGACWHTDTSYPTKNQEMMQTSTAFFKQTDWITRFAWFTNRASDTDSERSCRLVDNAGNLTSLGIIYNGF